MNKYVYVVRVRICWEDSSEYKVETGFNVFSSRKKAQDEFDKTYLAVMNNKSLWTGELQFENEAYKFGIKDIGYRQFDWFDNMGRTGIRITGIDSNELTRHRDFEIELEKVDVK